MPYFNEPHGQLIEDIEEIGAPAEQLAFPSYVFPSYKSSSASDYDSTPSDGGGDTNPTTPTAGPGGSPTQRKNL